MELSFSSLFQPFSTMSFQKLDLSKVGWTMTSNNSFKSLDDVLAFLGSTTGLQVNMTVIQPISEPIWLSLLNITPLLLGTVGFIVNILSIIVSKTSKTFRKSSLRYYIYFFVSINCATILS